MHVLVIGAGGREHALCWGIARSPLATRLSCAPGNGGIARLAECIDIAVSDFDGIVAYCQDQAVEFVVVGPEVPLVDGLVDRLEAEGILAFGPSARAAILESSKVFTKEMCRRHNIPTAAYARFTDIAEARDYIRDRGAPIVVKADGLAAGKGAIVCETTEEALAAAEDVLGGRFGAAGDEIVVEQFMVGEEASFFALCDGRNALPLATAQDHKAVFDGDKGPNTGGMGAYSPAPVMTDEMCQKTMERIILPTMRAMEQDGRPFKGVLYAGLMITERGPQLIEYNVRFGDPECQVLLARWKSDPLAALIAAAKGHGALVDQQFEVLPGDHDPGLLALVCELVTVELVARDELLGCKLAAVLDGVLVDLELSHAEADLVGLLKHLVCHLAHLARERVTLTLALQQFDDFA